MKTLTFYKDGGRSITVNDVEDAAEVMIKDGWRLEEKPKAVKKAEPKTEVEEPEYKPTRRRARSNTV